MLSQKEKDINCINKIYEKMNYDGNKPKEGLEKARCMLEAHKCYETLLWHDLKENPDDLPKKYIGTVHDVCLDENGNEVVYFHDSKTWYNMSTGQKEDVKRWVSLASVKVEQVN